MRIPKNRLFDVIVHQANWDINMENVVVFDATEIASYIDRAKDDFTKEDYGCVAPPFITRPFWVEALTLPARSYPTTPLPEDSGSPEWIKAEIDRFYAMPFRRGAIVRALEFDTTIAERMKALNFFTEDPEEMRWLLDIRGIIQFFYGPDRDVFASYFPNAMPLPDNSLLVPIWNSCMIPIDRKGEVCGYRDKLFTTEIFPEKTPSLFEKQLHADLASNMAPMVLWSMSFLNARTEVELVTPNHAARKDMARRAGKKRGTLPLRSYYVLKVKPHSGDGDVTRPEPLVVRHSEGKRRHVVHGHMRRVGEGGLFGRGHFANELIYIPDHERGKSSLGQIDKDYKLEK